MKILIFRGIFACQMNFMGFSGSPLHKVLYTDLTEKAHVFPFSHFGVSFPLHAEKGDNKSYIFLSWSCLCSSNHLRNVSLHPLLATSATLMFCSLHISNRSGNLLLSGLIPHQASLQKSVPYPSPITITLFFTYICPLLLAGHSKLVSWNSYAIIETHIPSSYISI